MRLPFRDGLFRGGVRHRAEASEATQGWEGGQDEKGSTKDGMVGWHHQLNGHESARTAGDGEGQGSLARCSPGGREVGHN